MEFLGEHWLDILTTILGLVYIWLEYRASIALWFIGIIMPALDIYLYWSHGLYVVIAVMGFFKWKQLMKDETISVDK